MRINKKLLVITLIFMMVFSSSVYAMNYQDFINTYPNDYIYRIVFPNGHINYISSPVKLEFGLSDVYKDGNPVTGKCLVIYNTTNATYYRLNSAGNVITDDVNYYYLLANENNRIGYEGNIDIYRWNGNSFFLPTVSTFLRGLVGPTRTILQVGFGIVLVMLLVRLLTVYFPRLLHRSI